MFNLNRSQDDNKKNSKDIKFDWLKFTSSPIKDEMLKSLSVDNKFISEELKMRSMVVEMLRKEFGKNIENIKGYDFLVDSVVNKLKEKQINSSSVKD